MDLKKGFDLMNYYKMKNKSNGKYLRINENGEPTWVNENNGGIMAVENDNLTGAKNILKTILENDSVYSIKDIDFIKVDQKGVQL